MVRAMMAEMEAAVAVAMMMMMMMVTTAGRWERKATMKEGKRRTPIQIRGLRK